MASEINTVSFNMLVDAPAFCFTGDMDWAPESMIAETLKIFDDSKIPYTPFVTHASKVIDSNYQGEKAKYVGVHPNFLQGSSQGNNYDEVMVNVMKLAPQAKAFRSHGYFDLWSVSRKFYTNGMRYDSNLSLHLQPNLVPLQHSTGLMRFPSFLDDYIYADRERNWDFSHVKSLLQTPGLKIFNFHPVHVCLNTPDIDYYNSVKEKVNNDNWKALAFKGKGVRTFLMELIQFVSSNSGLGIFYLDDLHNFLTEQSAEETFFDLKSKRTHVETAYKAANDDNRAAIVRDKYNEIKDSKNIYATSRDINIRELEIDFFKNSISSNFNVKGKELPKILDIGCGNGYTNISLAKQINAEYVGVDFSENMIEAADYLKEKFKDVLKCDPKFQLGDVRKLDFKEDHFDFVLSARCLLNLPSKEAQFLTIKDVHRVLKPNGIYVMAEGTRDGLVRLNEWRSKIGLEAIPDTGDDNVSSLKFDEKEIDTYLSKYFKVVGKHDFGMYYFLSRVVYPSVIFPDRPKFKSRFNEIARKIALSEPDFMNLGHVRGLVLKKI